MGNRTPWLGFDPQQKGGRAHAGLPCKFCKGGVSQAPHGTAKIKMPCDSGVILFCCMSYGESNTVVGVRPAAKRRAGARRFALQILQGRRQPSPARDCQNKNALRQRGNFILLYVIWGIEHRGWGSTRSKKAGGRTPVCPANFARAASAKPRTGLPK